MITFKVGDEELIMQDGQSEEEFATKMIERVLVQREKGNIIISADNLKIHVLKHPASVDDGYETLSEYLKEKCRKIVQATILHRRDTDNDTLLCREPNGNK